MTSNRIFVYCVFSTFALAATIANACRAHSNFYSVAIYLSKSSRSVLVSLFPKHPTSTDQTSQRSSPISASSLLSSSVASSRKYSLVLYNHAKLRYVLTFIHSPLLLNISQRLYDQTWMFVTESLLAFTIFRDEFDVPFLLMFGFLLFVKCFHWLLADRVESVRLSISPTSSLSSHSSL